MRRRITHLSVDGISTPLGLSQVLAVSERLRKLGWVSTILSLEPESAGDADLERLMERTTLAGIRWLYRPYRSGRARVAENVVSMVRMIAMLRGTTDVFHCRSYFGAFFPAFSSVLKGVPYVFDTRGYWVDEKIESGRWFQDRVSRSIARRVERELYERASAVVSLTELAAEDVRRGRFGRPHATHRSICIPTCVDYAKFTMAKGPAPHEFLREGTIVAYVGSLNPSYEYRASLRLAALILERNPHAKFLALTVQVPEMNALADQFGIPVKRRLIRQVSHCEIHAWLPWIDFGLTLLVPPNQAKRASMPTKLGEFLATGVSPIAHGANEEISHWVERAGSGLVLPDLSFRSLERAAEFAVAGAPDSDVLAKAREVAQSHFSLESGVKRYDRLFREVLSQAG